VFFGLVFFGGIAAGIQNIRRRAAKINMRDYYFESGLEQIVHHTKPGTWEWTPRQRLLLSLSLVALTGVAVHALVDFPLQIASIQLYTAAFLGICWGSGAWSIETKKPKAKAETGN
jgi:hypothetical protein